ncbi:MAG: hypothetical protein IJS81_00155 [Selenomonadaceae bacterium]|nr:hypothetical protein [Selenomonadaceae bacterium]
MRKSNSVFKTAFVSESGAELNNNDYFAFVEYDDYACYILASGITDFESSEAAKEAVEHLILSFEEHPSMAKGTLAQFMKETNERLLSGSHVQRLKASVIMLVTDYEKFRYAAAGNVRLRMYRKGRFLLSSSDMSLADDLIKKGESDTPLDRHEERNNLYAYLGKKGTFDPYVSKKYKLEDADIISLYSNGFWEHVDAQEIDEIFADASDNPQESVDLLEDVLLSRQPQNLKSYTIVAIFIDKIYRDPERERKRLRYIKIALIVLVILIIIGIIFYIFYRVRENKIDTLKRDIMQMQSFMDAENFVRARERANSAAELARELNIESEDGVDRETLNSYLILLDKILQANELYMGGNYNSAYDNYLEALKYTSASNGKIRDYISQRMNEIENQMNLQQFMLLGDHLFQNENYDDAEAMYKKAMEEAAIIHDQTGRANAVAALEKVYDKRAEIRKDADQKLNDKKQIALADLLKKGDTLLAAGDFAGAQQAYLNAKSLADNPADRAQVSAALDALDKAWGAKKQLAMSDALKKGDDLLAAGDIDGAEKAYLDARNLSDNPADRAQTGAALGAVSDARAKKTLEERTSKEERQQRFEDAIKIEKQGDDSFESGDYTSAQMYYAKAIKELNDLLEKDKAQSVQNKFDAAKKKFLESEGTKIEAEDTEQKARDLYADKNFEDAKAHATRAKELYEKLGMKSKVADMDILIEQIATDAQIADALK